LPSYVQHGNNFGVLCFNKGTKGEPITREHVKDLLNKVNPDYKKYVAASLQEAQAQLDNVFGCI